MSETQRQPDFRQGAALCLALVPVLFAIANPANAQRIQTTSFIEGTWMAVQFNPLVAKACREHPDAGNLTLAKMLHKKHPLQFVTVEKARTLIRHYRGNNGARTRKAAERRGTARANRKPGEMPKLPESAYKEPVPFELDASKILVLSDTHFPYQDNVAIEAALKRGDEFKPTYRETGAAGAHLRRPCGTGRALPSNSPSLRIVSQTSEQIRSRFSPC